MKAALKQVRDELSTLVKRGANQGIGKEERMRLRAFERDSKLSFAVAIVGWIRWSDGREGPKACCPRNLGGRIPPQTFGLAPPLTLPENLRALTLRT